MYLMLWVMMQCYDHSGARVTVHLRVRSPSDRPLCSVAGADPLGERRAAGRGPETPPQWWLSQGELEAVLQRAPFLG